MQYILQHYKYFYQFYEDITSLNDFGKLVIKSGPNEKKKEWASSTNVTTITILKYTTNIFPIMSLYILNSSKVKLYISKF